MAAETVGAAVFSTEQIDPFKKQFDPTDTLDLQREQLEEVIFVTAVASDPQKRCSVCSTFTQAAVRQAQSHK